MRVPPVHRPISIFQLQLRASDGRDPPRISNATVTVSITRDESTPQFFGTPYDNARVSENAEVGRVFFNRVRAADQDLQVREHVIQRCYNNNMLTSFMFISPFLSSNYSFDEKTIE